MRMVDGCHGKEYRRVAETASTGRWLSLACALLAGLVYLVIYDFSGKSHRFPVKNRTSVPKCQNLRILTF